MSKIINVSQITSKIQLPDSTYKDITTESNQSIIDNMADFTAIRSCIETYAIPSQEIEQCLLLTNDCDIAVKNVRIIDTIGNGAEFQTGTVSIDGSLDPTANPETGIQLDQPIEPNNSIEITYKVMVSDAPEVDEFSTISQITYDTDNTTGLSTTSNTIDTPIVNEKLTVDKTSNLSAVIKGQTLTYQITVTNEGNVKNTNIVLTDPIPSAVTFQDASVKIDETPQADADPRNGITLSDLNPGDKTVVKFDVTVN